MQTHYEEEVYFWKTSKGWQNINIQVFSENLNVSFTESIDTTVKVHQLDKEL